MLSSTIDERWPDVAYCKLNIVHVFVSGNSRNSNKITIIYEFALSGQMRCMTLLKTEIGLYVSVEHIFHCIWYLKLKPASGSSWTRAVHISGNHTCTEKLLFGFTKLQARATVENHTRFRVNSSIRTPKALRLTRAQSLIILANGEIHDWVIHAILTNMRTKEAQHLWAAIRFVCCWTY